MRLRLIIAAGLIAVLALAGCSAGAKDTRSGSGGRTASSGTPVVGSDDLAFVRVNVRGRHIWRVHPDGTGASQVTTGSSQDDQPAWSPDRRSIAFVRRQKNQLMGWGPTSLCVAPASGGQLSATQRFASDLMCACFSPDGTRIAFADLPSGSRRGTLGVGIFDLRSHNTTYVARVDDVLPATFNLGENFLDASMSWSPDGTRLLVGEYTVEAARTGIVAISSGTTAWLRPGLGNAHWSPDGRSIVLDQDIQSGSAVEIADADGTVRRVLVSGEATSTSAWAAGFSPDGKRVAFSDYHGAIWTIGADGSGKRKVIDDASSAVWSAR